MINLIDDNSDSRLSILEFISKIEQSKELVFSTSGTTGSPKYINHNVDLVMKNVKNDSKSSVWGLTYDYSKIAGSHVIVQAYKNKNLLVNLYKKSRSETHKLIRKYKITHISGTPTFFRLNFNNEVFENLKQVTLGGEVVTEGVIKLVSSVFPNAKISNIYALTEFGSILASSSHLFKLSDRSSKFVKIKNNKIHILFQEKWHNTNDLVDLQSDGRFSIIGRESTMINVGGQKVNPLMIEELINSFPKVKSSKVFGKKNSLIGNIVSAEVLCEPEFDMDSLKKFLRKKLRSFEIPRIIKQVRELKLNETGKISRI
ncbi:MAG: long-chain fatty acid--CoA ligase [Rickettsiales bacterium TMED289]|nr:MAG: long-chain fatty acid--CoA ligase [Rickettsiales bacterium TMED289]|tara:strand:+ start:5507 stop:6451 length:945 start_codon:yes stop_codon:yes gene_type:complete